MLEDAPVAPLHLRVDVVPCRLDGARLAEDVVRARALVRIAADGPRAERGQRGGVRPRAAAVELGAPRAGQPPAEGLDTT